MDIKFVVHLSNHSLTLRMLSSSLVHQTPHKLHDETAEMIYLQIHSMQANLFKT